MAAHRARASASNDLIQGLRWRSHVTEGSQMRKAVLVTVVAGTLAIAPAAAQADEDFFVVDTTSDSGALTACTGAAGDCSLRGAFTNADDADATDADTIVFDATIFDGVETVPGEATIVLASGLASDENLILGTSCSSTSPCAGIDGPFGENAIGVNDGSFSMNGVAIFGTTGGGAGLFKGTAGDSLSLVNNYFGLKLDGTASGNERGVTLSSGNAQIGGVGSAPNYFAANLTGLQVFTADNVTVQGNVFGVRPNGVVEANTASDIDLASNALNDGPQNITIGATPNDSTPACDDGCNVIAAAGGFTSRGIEFTTQGSDAASGNVTIQGNHIGLNAAGTASTGTGILVAVASGDGVTVEGNHLAGGALGVTAGSSAEGVAIKDNSIGTNSAETAVVDGAQASSIFLNSFSADPALVQGNLVAQDPVNTQEAITIGNAGATIDENQIGIEGVANSGGGIGVSLTGNDHLVEENTIVETSGDAIVLRNAVGNTIAANTIGIGDDGIAGEGIEIAGPPSTSLSNVIGGETVARANTFDGVTGDAIRLVGDTQDQNRIQVNLGSSNGLFVDLEGDDGEGNGATGPNAGIEAPKVKKVKKEEVSGEGVPGGEVWVYRSRSDKKEVPSGLKKLLGTKNVKNDGTWKFKPDKKIKGKHVITALQADDIGNSSELSKGKQPK